MNPIDSVFQALRSKNRCAFIPFITCGDPSLDATVRLAGVLAERGADLIEIGFPYSDPIADGPVIQASYSRALDKGLHIDDVFSAIARIREKNETPLVGMLSYSLVYRRGIGEFFDRAQQAGLSGAIVPDLPLEEAHAMADAAKDRDFKFIQLVTPTTSRERAAQIAKTSTGLLYCVSVAGITGERDRLPAELLNQLAWLRTQTDLPLCVGFGVSKPEHVRQLKDAADGVIVGSALVRRLAEAASRPLDAVLAEIGEYVSQLLSPLQLGD